MTGLLIADNDIDSRARLANLFIESGYDVTATGSLVSALYGILKKTAQVVLLSSEFDDVSAAELIPLMKKCNRNLAIILVADEISLPLIRRARRAGIFYHALKPARAEDREEIRQAVRCAFDNLAHDQEPVHQLPSTTITRKGDRP